MTFACVFPGQGSQSVGMLSELLTTSEIVPATFQEASQVLGYDLAALVTEGPEDEINSTDRTQPALLTAGVALWRLFCDTTNARPSILAGHSLGEYTALVCAGALQFRDAVSLVRARGEAMKAAVPAGQGAMAAILGLDDQQVIEACASVAEEEIVSAVNFNSPGQVVIAGHASAVDRAVAKAKEMGARRAVPLAVSVPSHCDLMAPAAEALSGVLADIEVKPPEIPVVHNVDAATHNDPQDIKASLIAQVQKPVKWGDSVLVMKDQGVTGLVELGPGKVLSGLNRRIDRSLFSLPVFDNETLQKAVEHLGDS